MTTTKVKFKGSKRLERRRQARLIQASDRAKAVVSPYSRAQPVNRPSLRHLDSIPSVTSLSGILEKRAKPSPTPFYKDLHWVSPAKDGAAAMAMKVTEMPKPHLLAAISHERDKRIAFTRMASASYPTAMNKEARTRAQKAAAIHCAWLVCLEAEAMRRDPSYQQFITQKGLSLTQPTPAEIAALPSVFVGS
ncbi:hypothetical protein CcrC1_gp273 [Caulobacter phage C1]|nr:hypothetical protein CcrC1_gp273 [Caulobacter phage C1]UTU08502.1 hypothetical protein CcrC2_gp274 [Caulobacter phage C2]UTU09017.1 hypothetical protein CcrJ4_gp268 [Caulobacter phage J4]UTU10135.1 hypothetical protein CcrRB23_gp273 [Caulobacter phage RB23]WGN97169.1 hypothetical protein [Bertelyvirus sp.]